MPVVVEQHVGHGDSSHSLALLDPMQVEEPELMQGGGPSCRVVGEDVIKTAGQEVGQQLGELASEEPEDCPETPGERLGESVNERRLSCRRLVDGERQYDPQDQAHECQDDDNRKDGVVLRGSTGVRAAPATSSSVGQRYLTADSWWARSGADDASSAGTTETLRAS